MKIKLNNGIELSPILATGEKRHIQNASRDALSFIFPVETSLDELDALFTVENCEKIIITDDNGEDYIHNAYTVRVELKRSPIEVVPATESEDAVFENRVFVTMAQRTYQESQINEMQTAIAALAGMEG